MPTPPALPPDTAEGFSPVFSADAAAFRCRARPLISPFLPALIFAARH